MPRNNKKNVQDTIIKDSAEAIEEKYKAINNKLTLNNKTLKTIKNLQRKQENLDSKSKQIINKLKIQMEILAKQDAELQNKEIKYLISLQNILNYVKNNSDLSRIESSEFQNMFGEVWLHRGKNSIMKSPYNDYFDYHEKETTEDKVPYYSIKEEVIEKLNQMIKTINEQAEKQSMINNITEADTEIIYNEYLSYLKSLIKPIETGTRNIEELRTLITNQQLIYQIADNKTIYELSSKEVGTIISKEDIGAWFKKDTVIKVAFSNSIQGIGLAFDVKKLRKKVNNVNKELSETFVYAKKEFKNMKSSEILEVIDYLQNISGRKLNEKRKAIIDNWSTTKEFSFTTELDSTSKKMQFLPYYLGGDAARKNSDGTYSIIQAKGNNAQINFVTTINQMEAIKECFPNGTIDNVEDIGKKFRGLFTFQSDKLSDKIIYAANQNAIKNINTLIEQLMKR